MEFAREVLGHVVREEWIRWAKEQPNPKPSWLVEWEGLSEPDREVDRRIGMRIYNLTTEANRAAYLTELNDLQDEIARLRKALETILEGADIYPSNPDTDTELFYSGVEWAQTIAREALK